MNNTHFQYFTHLGWFGEECACFWQVGLWRSLKNHKSSFFHTFFCIMHVLPFRYDQGCVVSFYLCHWFPTKLCSFTLGPCLPHLLFTKPKNAWCRVDLQELIIQLAWDNGSYVDIYANVYFVFQEQIRWTHEWFTNHFERNGLQRFKNNSKCLMRLDSYVYLYLILTE